MKKDEGMKEFKYKQDEKKKELKRGEEDPLSKLSVLPAIDALRGVTVKMVSSRIAIGSETVPLDSLAARGARGACREMVVGRAKRSVVEDVHPTPARSEQDVWVAAARVGAAQAGAVVAACQGSVCRTE